MPTLDPARARVAVLYQAVPPPVLDGVRKDAKPGGYADSGADIAFALRARGIGVVTPLARPDPRIDMDWVFPDTDAGIAAAIAAGANVLWANTVLFAAHPLAAWIGKGLGNLWCVGQDPASQQRFDDKYATNRGLREAGLAVAPGLLLGRAASDGVIALDDLQATPSPLAGMTFPAVAKPVRGRGSQGVTVVADAAELATVAAGLIDGGRFGALVMVEPFLVGEELTVTVMPAGTPHPSAPGTTRAWCLPPVRRFNHEHGVAPYNGVVAVTRNSAALSEAECADPRVTALLADCIAAAERVNARAPIRIDCRANDRGTYFMFDLNMKPNMTGAGRPGRDEQDSLSAIAARAIGWDYATLLLAMLAGAWRPASKM